MYIKRPLGFICKEGIISLVPGSIPQVLHLEPPCWLAFVTMLPSLGHIHSRSSFASASRSNSSTPSHPKRPFHFTGKPTSSPRLGHPNLTNSFNPLSTDRAILHLPRTRLTSRHMPTIKEQGVHHLLVADLTQPLLFIRDLISHHPLAVSPLSLETPVYTFPVLA